MARSVEDKRENEKRVSGLMIELYCHGNHGTRRGELCDECRALRDYAFQRIDRCPYMETKTFCSNCRTHCYRPEMRERIRTVMRWSGPRMIFHHLEFPNIVLTTNRNFLPFFINQHRNERIPCIFNSSFFYLISDETNILLIKQGFFKVVVINYIF